jgi:hypothetical protein
MAKNLKDIIKDRAGRNVPKGEEDFLAAHSVKDHEDVNKNKNVFTAGNVKAEQEVQKNDPGQRHGYRSIKAAEKAYEETSVAEAKKKTSGKKVGSEDDRNANASDYGYSSTGSTVSEAKCNMTEAGTMCAVHGLKECWKEDTYAHNKEMGEMTDSQMKKREDIVKGMKKNYAGFKQKYGERAKSVMYATATKQAMKEGFEDAEGEMAKTQLRALASKANDLVNMMQDNQDLESWVQSKITAAKHDIDAIHDYLIHREKPVEGTDTAMQFPHVNVDNAGFNV